LRKTAKSMTDAGLRPGAPFAAAFGVKLALARMALTNFRSYGQAALAPAAAPVVVAGPNGAGKTNLLEAISLLSPGRGLRGAKFDALQRRAPREIAGPGGAFADSLWAVSAEVMRPDGCWEIGSGYAPVAGGAARRVLHLNGAPAHAADVAAVLPMLWLTPAMDRLFQEGAGERRRFLDRLVFAMDPGHARRVTRYDRAASERLRLLKSGVHDPTWLEALEQTMAAEGAEITAGRMAEIARLNAELAARSAAGAFPCAQLALADGSPPEADRLQAALAEGRMRDAQAGRTLAGPHLADLAVRHTQKRADARECSTGEQKALLISIVLANAWAKTKRLGGVAPLLLLDEIAAHLDAVRRAALFEEIVALGAQAWLTGTDADLFDALKGRAQFFTFSTGEIVRQG
jgi:DNA replication and repair protein RecF